MGVHLGAAYGFVPRTPAGPRGIGGRNFRYRQRPIYVYRHNAFFRSRYFRFRFGPRFNSYWWPCSPFWGWGLNCSAFPSYGYGFGNYASVYSPSDQSTSQTYENPAYQNSPYLYGGEERELPQLYLKDGTMYAVTDYWLVNGQFHFTMFEAGSTRPLEHVIDFDELDLQRTIDVNTQRGFRFMLRNEPAEQYLQDHQDVRPPVGPPR